MDETSERDEAAARRLWTLYEHVHAVTYFAPEARQAYEDVGVRGFWRGYFAGRAAPMGQVGPGVVEATFFGFHREFVARALPSVWEMAPPTEVLAARDAGAARALRGLAERFDLDDDAAEEAGSLLVDAAMDADPAGRPLFAANRDVAVPTDPWARLWHGATLWREHRGDGHVAALVVAGLGGCSAHVLRLAADGEDPALLRSARGWPDDEWSAASASLVARGLMRPDGTVTDEGLGLRTEVERRTDESAGALVRRAGADAVRRLDALLRPIAAAVQRSDLLPYPNPIGLSPPPD
ncbi:SCO6745 family protein [Actinomarinicola tropica]|uniref:SalK n=1 Tax=Actinomarinicola tropica TaxID=2789776 RepID=A0A5Q2RN76_9ACTN|nr:hypothetical protein [Actinomarinicola tropica]QGG96402.1 hypothetical protein GH723_15565 [Actinomarinicola tropica]